MVREPLNFKLWLPPGHPGLVSWDQWVKRATILAGAHDPEQQQEEGLPFHI